MAKRKSMSKDNCPVARSLDVVGDRWSMMIVRDAFDGISRFGEFQRNLGVARNILADRLKHLVEQGILAARPASDGTAYPEYVLTNKGQQLFPIVVGLRQWAEKHLFSPGEPRSSLIEREDGSAVDVLQVRSHDGRILHPDETIVKKVAAEGH